MENGSLKDTNLSICQSDTKSQSLEDFCFEDQYIEDSPCEQNSFDGNKSMILKKDSKFRTKPCKFFNTKVGCRNQENCTFNHVKLKFCWWETFSKCSFKNLCWNKHKNEEKIKKTKGESNKKKRIKINLKVELEKLKIKMKGLKKAVNGIKEIYLGQSQMSSKATKNNNEADVHTVGETSDETVSVKPKNDTNLNEAKSSSLLPRHQEARNEDMGYIENDKNQSVKVDGPKISSIKNMDKNCFWTGLRKGYERKLKKQ